MSDRMRGSLFNILGDMTCLSVLDAFAGTGALGIEAISRGAKSATFIERDKVAQRAIEANVNSLGLSSSTHLIKATVAAWDDTVTDRFDMIFADPPYHDMQMATISRLIKHMQPKGLMILSYPGRESVPTVNGVVVVDNRSYGDAALAFYRLV